MAHHRVLRQSSLKQLFAGTTNRFDQFSAEIVGVFFDYSKNWITDNTITLLCALAEEQGLSQAIEALFSGKKMNLSENRAASHVALRSPANTTHYIDGKNVMNDVQTELQKMARIAEQLEKKMLRGFSGKPIDTILHIGIGGSDIGSALYHRVMEKYPKKAACYFLTEFDYFALQNKLALCNPETTIVIVASKSFNTQETLTIFKTVKKWLSAAATSEAKIQAQCYAVTANEDAARSLGLAEDHILKIWDWVGGRYSIWSAVNLSMILVYGMKNFQKFLHGAHQVDQHFQSAPFASNVPVILGLLSIWYNNFFHIHTQAIVPYSARLNLLTTYLQQLHMESLGKTVSIHGEKIDYPTGNIIWGDVGPNSQHSFHQLLMQGSHIIPIDFILPLSESEEGEYDIKRAAYCLSQSQTLLQGFAADPVSHQTIAGNCPSTTILLDQLTPESLGALIAVYEHKVFVQSVIWHINAFDQWGVERGKQLSEKIIASLENQVIDSMQYDSSTIGLLARISRSLQK